MTSKIIFCVLGIIMGILMVIEGFGIHNSSSRYEWQGKIDTEITFGADFYTDEYKATATTAEYAQQLSYTMYNFVMNIGFVIATFGGVIICFFGYKLGGLFPENTYQANSGYSKSGSHDISHYTNCKHCGKKISDKAVVCIYCGKPTANYTEPKDNWKCPKCGMSNPRTSRICKNCEYQK